MLFLTMPVAFVQLVFLPGFLVLVLMNLHKTNPGRVLFLSAILSGIFNMLAGYLLFAVKCFNQPAILIILAAEVIALWFALKRNKSAEKNTFDLWEGFRNFLSDPSKLTRILFLSACIVLAWFAIDTILSVSKIFLNWDAVLSWNRWATEWTTGKFPYNTRSYPQLAPLNWATAYLICGSTLEFVPHLTCHYLGFLTLLGIFELGCTQKKAGLFAAVPLCALFFANLTICRDGSEADFYIMFFCFASVYMLFLVKESSRYLWIAMLTAAGAAAVKQSGVAVWVLYPIALALVSKEFRNWKKCVCYLLIGILIAGTYFAIFTVRNARGLEITNVGYMISNIYGERTYAERGIAASKMFVVRLAGGLIRGVALPKHAQFDRSKGEPYRTAKYLGRYILLYAALLTLIISAFCCMPPGMWKTLLLTWGIPYLLVWHFTFCYDLRNLGPVIPLLACGIGLGLFEMVQNKPGRKHLLFLLCILAAGYAVALRNFHFTLSRNDEAVKIGDGVLNQLIASMDIPEGKIASDYEFLHLNPRFRGKVVGVPYSIPEKRWLDLHKQTLVNPEVSALLVPDYAKNEFLIGIRELEEKKIFRKEFHACGYTLYIRNLKE